MMTMLNSCPSAISIELSLSSSQHTISEHLPELRSAVAESGFAFARASTVQPLLEAQAALTDWADFEASWNTLELDQYMADGGRYRRRRYAVYSIEHGAIQRAPHAAHFQSREYNPLNGDVERWFAPIEQSIGCSASLRAILSFCRALFTPLQPAIKRWHIEVHQFRIEARVGISGLPTPEGMHRDGVDYVLAMMVRRRNIRSGATAISRADGTSLGAFTLTDPFDAALIDDARVYHGVTPVTPEDDSQPAYRDVIVVTLRALRD